MRFKNIIEFCLPNRWLISKMTKRVFILLFILLFTGKYVESGISILPDTTSDRTVQINEIHVIGNKKTKENIILREAGFKKGESYQFEELKETAPWINQLS